MGAKGFATDFGLPRNMDVPPMSVLLDPVPGFLEELRESLPAEVALLGGNDVGEIACSTAISVPRDGALHRPDPSVRRAIAAQRRRLRHSSQE